MNEKFDNQGVHHMQNHILSLTPALRQHECDQIRSDLVAWLRANFDLHPNQHSQLAQMPSELTQQLGHRIARSWESDVRVTFQKDTRDQDDVPDLKELIIFGLDDPETGHNRLQNTGAIPPLLIQIRYKYRM
ncbi:hypothetical protein [Sphingobacterium paucimobilis]|uniref:Uncharacterized protein n=1 Tax=Sphingobacterium paucimobilis HER1398 TaxID=1346330 RepID=U2HQY2_9SPHI|nr:hypothetical protein [Sphingobacterium paucimobilis]ERJ57690.1 hypothetical protein M472_02815 [Sphingobacterium paucimobilis HER1398]